VLRAADRRPRRAPYRHAQRDEIRPSYPEEAERLVEHLSTIGIRRIAIAYQNNAFGKEVLKGTETAAKKHGVTLARTTHC
jgi:ABC-type branched-subunit amino acid transport system substrate-binding protein